MAAKNIAKLLFLRDLKISYRQGSDYLLALCFWLILVVFFPLSGNISPLFLESFAPGILWLGLLLTQLLNLPKFFREDYRDGVLAELAQSPNDFFFVVCCKLLNFWVIHYAPIFLLAPLLALMLHLSTHAMWTLELTILLGGPSVALLSGLVASLTLAIKNNTLLVNLLFLPLTVPMLIFACAAIHNAQLNLPTNGPLAWLGVILLLSLLFIPASMSFILKANFE